MSSLQSRITSDPDSILENFLEWVIEQGIDLYDAQEEAILEIMEGRHVVLNTPTGSGKSLVALAMHFRSLCLGERSFYTAPIKALVSEKFFALCDTLGPSNVGMLTGDASVNAQAPVVCCTAEILANMALRQGRQTPADSVVMDEFHYYADPSRGAAWQIPLLELPDTTFMLMSATLGDMTRFKDDLEQRTDKVVSIVTSDERPVPLDFSYQDIPLHQTVNQLASKGVTPIYLVNFTQREAAERAQNLTSLNLTTKEEKRAILDALRGFRFDSPYGRDMQRFIRQGIGLHHAGLLPKYRLLVERLSQQGLLKLISGTDTLGVGVNIPIRTVLFSRLYKFDGTGSRLLSARDFHQVSGRAGRKGFDDAGSVVCLAPEHVIENKMAEAKAASAKQKRKAKKKSPPKGFVHYDEAGFLKLVSARPEPLRSQFSIDTYMLSAVLERSPTVGKRDGGYRRLIDIISRCHETPKARRHLRRQAAEQFRALKRAQVIEITRFEQRGPPHVSINGDLQKEFSLFHTLSVFLLEALFRLDRDSETYALDVVSIAESIQENPRVILLRQVDALKGQLVAALKAEGLDYSDRMDRLDKVDYAKPLADFLYDIFDDMRQSNRSLRDDNVRPKSIVRDMYERFATFNDYTQDLGMQRSEGVLLRYLSQTYRTLLQTVPESYRTEDFDELLAWLRAVIAHVDSSLVREWEAMLLGDDAPKDDASSLPAGEPRRIDITRNTKQFYARIRAEMHTLAKALAERDYAGAVLAVRQELDAEGEPVGAEGWGSARFESSVTAFYESYPHMVFNHRSRFTDLTRITRDSNEARVWQVSHTLVDPEEDNMWYIEGSIDMSDPEQPDGPLLTLSRVGC